MIRRAFTMKLKPGALPEYTRQHEAVWPEMVRQIGKSGIRSMTIFNSGDTLFLFSEVADEDAWTRLWDSDVSQRWSAVMEPLMFQTPDGKVESGDLTELFHLKTTARRPSTKAKPKKPTRSTKRG